MALLLFLAAALYWAGYVAALVACINQNLFQTVPAGKCHTCIQPAAMIRGFMRCYAQSQP